jgi:WD40 repeat protein
MQVWEVISEKCLHHYEGHTDWVLDVAWLPDGNLLATSRCASGMLPQAIPS